jgi:hypothetical protein
MKFLLFCLFAIGINSLDSSFYEPTISCITSQSGTTLVLNGGPFNNISKTSPLSCSQLNSFLPQNVGYDVSFPIVFTVSCGVICPGCGYSMNYNSSGSTKKINACSGTSAGNDLEGALNGFYALTVGNLSATYDWCGLADCTSSDSKLALILGIVFGIIGLAIIVGLIVFCVKRSRKGGFTAGETTSRTI